MLSQINFNPLRSIPDHLIHVILALCLSLAGHSAYAETSFVTVENRSGQIVKVAVPGGKAQRLQPGTTPTRIDIEATKPNGIDAKAWWISNPRQLCVIFVRYEGHMVIAGSKNIRCLGH
ncbi:MAG: hypothetical protein GY815_03165 [Gammaproteobacteria bacterium]|nr:hypothetical protein [Gammaproteobacteria bacterium]